jgi:hypothetical protein
MPSVPEEETRTTSRLPAFARRALVAAAVLVVLVLLADGVGREAPASTIDVPAMQHELSRVMHEQYLDQGFDYTPTVTCTLTGPLTYSCAAVFDTDQGLNTQPETITCSPPNAVSGQRCYTGSGFALQ